MKVVSSLLVLFAAALPAQPPPDRTFTDAVDVAEASVAIELPRLGRVGPSDFEPGDFVVEVAGERRGATGVSALDLKANPRPVLVYVDAVLAKPETVRLGTAALARHAPRLTALGPVGIVVDDGAPGGVERRLAASTEARAVETALNEIAGEDLGRDAYFESGNRPPGLESYRDVVRASADRLLAETSGRGRSQAVSKSSAARRPAGPRPAGSQPSPNWEVRTAERSSGPAATARGCGDPPCFLFWLSDGFPAVDDAGVRAAGDLEAGLAADGWIVVAMALHVPTPEPDYGAPRPVSFEEWKALTPGVKMAPPAGEISRLRGLSASSFDFYVEPRYEPLRRAATASCGAALRVEHQLETEFERLERRLLLRFEAEAAGTDEADLAALAALRFLPVDVRLAEVSRFADRRRLARRLGLVPPEERLRHGRWVRSP